MSQVEIEWKAFDSISLIVNRPSHDETFVDEMKLQWEQSLSDRQVQLAGRKKNGQNTTKSN